MPVIHGLALDAAILGLCASILRWFNLSQEAGSIGVQSLSRQMIHGSFLGLVLFFQTGFSV